MKLTSKQLKRLIKEEIENLMEQGDIPQLRAPWDPASKPKAPLRVKNISISGASGTEKNIRYIEGLVRRATRNCLRRFDEGQTGEFAIRFNFGRERATNPKMVSSTLSSPLPTCMLQQIASWDTKITSKFETFRGGTREYAIIWFVK